MIRSLIKSFFIILLLTNFIELSYTQESVTDSMMQVAVPELIVTATRNERMLSNVTVPALLINNKFIKLSGNIRLNDVLQEQTGLFLTSASGSSSVGGGVFGNGIQIQGMSPDYTLIMLDGEPLTGRQGGVIDLSRYSVGNIRKIEVIKGPSSALYGSEAMGGVINIMTEEKRTKSANLTMRYGSFNTADLNLSTNFSHKKSSVFLFANYITSDGYDLQTETPEKTQDPFHNITTQLKWTYRFSDKTRLVWNNRLFKGNQTSAFAFNGSELNITGSGITDDININPVFHHRFSEKLKSTLRLYTSLYRYEQQLNQKGSAEQYYYDNFSHNYYRVENQTDWDINDQHQLVAGGGYNLQTVETIRYRTKKEQHNSYLFVQHEWHPSAELTIIPGLRYDGNSDYTDRVTPKLSMQYKLSDKYRINFSYGSGFKAPDFRQLYLYYVNPAAQGYRVYGASEFSLPELEQQKAEGLIANILPDAYRISELRPESSHGFNLGGTAEWKKLPLTVDFNIFYNAINDLINYLPVATLKNNALVFSYLNVNRAFTTGMEINLKGKLTKKLEWNAGYQLLVTGDRDVLNKIKNSEVYGRNTPLSSARLLSTSDYTGLLGRSPHMANLKLFYQDENSGWNGSFRGIYRSKWGIVDLDGNKFANMDEEYAKDLLLLNISIGKTINKNLNLMVNINNLLHQIDPSNVPQMMGRHFMATCTWNFIN
jgi:outer membrane receptor for ferrienterochelin and colicins